MKNKCPHIRYCLFRRAYGYCIKQIGEECTFYKKIGGNRMTRDDLANKIVDMVFDGASNEEIAKMVEYSKEVIDKEKKND